MSRSLVTLMAAVAMVTTLAGCDGPDGSAGSSSSGGSQVPSYAEAACPDDVETLVLAEHRCGYVDVGDGVRLFVVRVEPPTPSDRAPVVETGTDLGTAPDYAGLSPVAARTDRPLVLVDLRGTGHSTPSLDCPEVDEAAPDAAAALDGTGDVATAVATCRQRLVDAGADPGSVDLASSAEDLHAVVSALGVDKVVASAHGTTGLVALEWARRHPADLEAMVLDTPYLGVEEPDPRVDRLVTEIAAACERQPACRAAHPDLGRAWARALDAAADQPLTIDSHGTPVSIDDEALRRAARWVLAGGPELGPTQVPELVDEAAAQPGPLLQRYADLLVAGPPLCVGWLPKCGGPRVAVGAALALNCPAVRDQSAWREACAAWSGGPVPAAGAPVTTPTLVLIGRFDPFAPPAHRVRARMAAEVPGAFFIEDPAGSHNVLGSDCLRAVRTSWLNGDLRRRPLVPPCLSERALVLGS